MHHRTLAQSLAPIAAALALCTALPAHAVGQLIDVQVVDRSSGATLTPIYYKGEWWIAGRPGAKYGVSLSSRTPQRTLSVVSLDGVNAISGDTAAWNQTGYVLDAYQRTQVDGWRKNMNQVAAFEFTVLPDSYAARTGRPANVGVIGVALFAERRRPPILRREVAPAEAERPSSLPVAAPAPSASSSNDAAPSAKADSLADDSLLRSRIGTGHGEIENSSITYTQFQRAQPTPNEVVTIHYDRVENLIAMGILPSPHTPPIADADPFPNSGRFVADPPPR